MFSRERRVCLAGGRPSFQVFLVQGPIPRGAKLSWVLILKWARALWLGTLRWGVLGTGPTVIWGKKNLARAESPGDSPTPNHQIRATEEPHRMGVLRPWVVRSQLWREGNWAVGSLWRYKNILLINICWKIKKERAFLQSTERQRKEKWVELKINRSSDLNWHVSVLVTRGELSQTEIYSLLVQELGYPKPRCRYGCFLREALRGDVLQASSLGSAGSR